MERSVPARLSRSEGRRFAFPVGLAFVFLAGILWWRAKVTLALVATGLGGSLLVAGLVMPTRLGPIYRAWMAMAVAISKVTTPIFMGVVYFIVMTPIGLARRTLGGNPVKHAPQGDSYWKARKDGTGRSNLERQF